VHFDNTGEAGLILTRHAHPASRSLPRHTNAQSRLLGKH
jgi:hypothetical protein